VNNPESESITPPDGAPDNEKDNVSPVSGSSADAVKLN
jgi:hypothetical protein